MTDIEKPMQKIETPVDPNLQRLQEMYRTGNRKQRKYAEKILLKSKMIPNGDNKQISMYKKMKKLEKNNLNFWFQKVKGNQERGKTIHERNTNKTEEEILKARLNEYKMKYGEVEGEKLFNEQLDKEFNLELM